MVKLGLNLDLPHSIPISGSGRPVDFEVLRNLGTFTANLIQSGTENYRNIFLHIVKVGFGVNGSFMCEKIIPV